MNNKQVFERHVSSWLAAKGNFCALLSGGKLSESHITRRHSRRYHHHHHVAVCYFIQKWSRILFHVRGLTLLRVVTCIITFPFTVRYYGCLESETFKNHGTWGLKFETDFTALLRAKYVPCVDQMNFRSDSTSLPLWYIIMRRLIKSQFTFNKNPTMWNRFNKFGSIYLDRRPR